MTYAFLSAGGGGAEGLAHCHTMAAVQRAAAQRSAQYFAYLLALWVQICGASLAKTDCCTVRLVF